MIEPWYLGGFESPTEWWEGTTASGQPFRAPRLTAAEAVAIAENVRAAALEARESRSTSDVIRVVSTAAARLTGDGADGDTARGLLQTELGWSEHLSRETLTGMSRSWTGEALTDLVRSEIGGPGPLDDFVEDPDWAGPGRRLRRAAGPPLILQVLAGNVPGVSITATIRALIARSGVLCKVAEPEPGLLALFARLVAEEDPVLGRCMAVTWWPGREFPPPWTEWTNRSGKVVVYGGEGAVQTIRGYLPAATELIAYGPGVGIAVILPDATGAEVELARDVLAYDQQGCVSPRLVYVVGDSANAFAGRLARALEADTRERPPPELAPEEAVAIRALRAEFEFRGYDRGETSVHAPGDELWWTVLADQEPDIRTEALPRVVRVHAVPALDALYSILQPMEGLIQALGYAGKEGLEALAAAAVRLGVSRVAPVGTAAWPPADWRHEGRFQLHPLLSWTDLETTA